MTPAQPLLRARERAGFSIDEMARLVGLEPSRLPGLERGDTYPPPELVERYALVLGLSVREFLAGEEPTSVAMLFRRMSREGGPFSQTIDSDMAYALGEFVRVARDVARLRFMLAEGPRPQQLAWLDRFEPRALVPRPELYMQAAEMASSVRAYLGLTDDDEIVSMRALVEQLGILTMFVEPDQIDRDIDGASMLDPHPAILVNLVAGGDKFWRTRMTLAHELCHLVFDRAELDPAQARKFFIFSPKGRGHKQQTSLHLFDHFEDLEARANAFAGELLAPATGIRRRLRALDPTSPESVSRIIAAYKIGKETAINRLKNVFGLSEAQRQWMLAQPTREAWSAGEHPDSVRPSGTQLRDAAFIDLVSRALAASRIDAIEARALLNLRLSDPLPEHAALTPQQRAPLRAGDSLARSAAENLLLQRVGLEYFVHSVEPTGDGWRAQILRREPDGRFVPIGALYLGPDLALRDDSALSAALT